MPKRTDWHQQDIMDALRAAGAQVESLHEVGGGVPDLLVCYRGTLYLLEIKARRGRRTKAQIEWHARWPVAVVRSVDDAFAAVGVEVAT